VNIKTNSKENTSTIICDILHHSLREISL